MLGQDSLYNPCHINMDVSDTMSYVLKNDSSDDRATTEEQRETTNQYNGHIKPHTSITVSWRQRDSMSTSIYNQHPQCRNDMWGRRVLPCPDTLGSLHSLMEA